MTPVPGALDDDVVNELFALGDEAERLGFIDREWWMRLAATGLLRMTLPVEFGGSGMSLADYLPVLETCSQIHGSIRMAVHAANSTWRIVAASGTPDQRERLLPPVAGGRYYGIVISEPRRGTGRDLGATARRTAGGWVLDGVKQWATLADRASVEVVAAQAVEADGTPLGVTTFLVRPDAPGVTLRPMAPAMGCRGIRHFVLGLEGVEVADDDVLGPVGSGLEVLFRGFLDVGKLSLAASCCGIAAGALEQSLGYATRRRTFGRPLTDRKQVQARLVAMEVDVAATRALVAATAARYDRGEAIVREAAMCKYRAIEMVGAVTDHAMKVHGGVGYTSAYPVNHLYRDARGTWFEEGTTEVQQNVIAGEMLAAWQPRFPAGRYGPDPGPDSEDLALEVDGA